MDPVDAMCVCVSCGRRPRGGRFLKCLHIACGACMDEHTDSEGARLCPRCTSTTESQPSGRLPRVPEGLVEYCEQHVGHSQQEQGNATPAHDDKGGEETERERQAKSLCDECVDESKAGHRCADCSFLLCDDHASGHGRKRAYAGHQVEPWQAADDISVAKGQPPKMKNKVATMCMLHPQRAVEKFCMTCDQPFCKRCLEATVGSCCCDGSCVQDALHSAGECLANLRGKFGMPATDDSHHTAYSSDDDNASEGDRTDDVNIAGDSNEDDNDRIAQEEVSEPEHGSLHLGNLSMEPAPASLRPQLLAPEPYVPEDNVAWNVHFGNYQDQLENTLDTVTEVHQTLSEEITSAFAEVRKSIDEQEATLRARLDKVIWRIMKPIEEQKETARHTLLAMERATRLFQFFSETGTDKLPLLLLSKWLKDLHTRQEKESGQKPCITPKVTFVPRMLSTYFNCAIIEQTTVASPSSFQVEILPPTNRECPVWVGVFARNADKTPLLCTHLSPDDEWCVSISSGTGTSDHWRFSQLSLSSLTSTAAQQKMQQLLAPELQAAQLGTSKSPGGSSGLFFSLSTFSPSASAALQQTPQQPQVPKLGTSKSSGATAKKTPQQPQVPKLGTSKSPGSSGVFSGLSSFSPSASAALQQTPQQPQVPKLGTSRSLGLSLGGASATVQQTSSSARLENPSNLSLQHIQCRPSNDVRKADLPAPTFDAVFYIPKRYFCQPIEIQVCLNGKAIGNGQTHTMNIAYSIASQGIP
ncbi:uncharacterized protein LOC135819741 isoform X2 [Sycon ciliatum]|uniref:uncharacterized protein LOC135819741 isoform X2 n=1 Tax=Sycon ciliatum TaxID=27933 RepID=UPI0031F6D765